MFLHRAYQHVAPGMINDMINHRWNTDMLIQADMQPPQSGFWLSGRIGPFNPTAFSGSLMSLRDGGVFS